MRSIFQVLVTTFGGPHGTKYSDLGVTSPGQTVQAITIRAGERVNAVSLDITDPSGQKSTLYHGEFITGIEAHWGEKDDHTRDKYIQFTTSSGKTISGGNPTKDIGKDSAPPGYQLGGFVGTCGKELDSVGVVLLRWRKHAMKW
ncbi:putative secreted protein [Phytophthora infestans]|uniref:Putative secreted protein n=1 Tax=Phytophthora infestans TaxID=4787 RepID=A0A8S9VDT0_PHYIN|nr:putative secreted protein [Phytophthora infestans]